MLGGNALNRRLHRIRCPLLISFVPAGQQHHRWLNIKTLSLVVLVVQSTSLVMLLRWSRSKTPDLYASSTLVFLSELAKLGVCVIIVGWEYFQTSAAQQTELKPLARISGCLQYIKQQAFSNVWDVLK